MNFKQPRLQFYHRKEDGTGALMIMELYPAYGTQCGYIRAIIAPQADVTYESGFDWQKRVQINLGTTDLIEILAVLTGKEEMLPNGAIITENEDKVYQVTFDALADGEFDFSLCYKTAGTCLFQDFVLTRAEGDGLRAIIEGCLHIVAFGK